MHAAQKIPVLHQEFALTKRLPGSADYPLNGIDTEVFGYRKKLNGNLSAFGNEPE